MKMSSVSLGRCEIRMRHPPAGGVQIRVCGGPWRLCRPASVRPKQRLVWQTGFEGMSDARAAFRPVTSVFVSRRRPKTCKDL
jgi:hypothetical protein